jgi:uncharacterized protein (TIGR02284 family)
MAPRTERETLNTLIEACRDGEHGFRLAADRSSDPELKRLFIETARQRMLFAAELLPYAHRLGGETDADGTTRGTLHRRWMMVRDVMTGHDERALLAEARRGEAAAAAVYADAVTSILPPDARSVVERQFAAIRNGQRALEEFGLA